MMSFPTLLEPNALTGANGFRLTGPNPWNPDLALASAGDLNGDGVDDLAIGVGFEQSGPGAAFVVFGRSGGFGSSVDLGALPPGAGLKIVGARVGDNAGFAVAKAGDVNGDGYGDVILSALRADLNGSESGGAYVLFGGPSLPSQINLANLDGSNGFVIPGAAAIDLLGAVASAGDFNGDGIGDIVVGAGGDDRNGFDSGAAYVVYGRSGGFPARVELSQLNGANGFRFTGLGREALVGAYVEGVGDVNGDGYDDVIVTTHGSGSDRSAYLLFGHAGAGPAVLDPTQLNGTNGVRITSDPGVTLMGHVASKVDFNGDGYGDIVLGGRAQDSEAMYNQLYVVYGRPGPFGAVVNVSRLNGSDGFKATGPAYFAWDGGDLDVDSAGDVNGDGFDDLLVSSQVYNGGEPGSASGSAYLLFGRSQTPAVVSLAGLAGRTGATFQDPRPGFMGFKTGAGGDFNGDGLSDLVVADPTGGFGVLGSGYVLFGQAASGLAAGPEGPTRPPFDPETYVRGGAQADDLRGGPGFDALEGGGGDDLLSGGGGVDGAIYSGRWRDYSWSQAADGGWIVRDLRPGAPDGTDRLTGVEMLAFQDRVVWIGAPLPAAVETAFHNVLRVGSTSPSGEPAAIIVSANLFLGKTVEASAADVALAAAGTTSVATLTYQFFTGRTPTEAGLDYLVSPTSANPANLNSDYYLSFSLENRYINFAVNLGAQGAGAAKFTAEYGGLTLAGATSKAYREIFGSEASDAKIAALLGGGRDLYLANLAHDGVNGVATKAAMVGWLLSEAEKSLVGPYARANFDYLIDLADGAGYGVDLIGVYGKPDPLQAPAGDLG